VRVVRLEGDAGAPADAGLFATHFAPGAQLVHGLGATETGICSQFVVARGERVQGDVLPIGSDVEDMEVRLLDEHGAPVASGEVGEIVVRSRFLATGYWHDAERTASAFRAEPGDPGLREYRTGDLGRRRLDGALEHLGRRDQRLRVRGLWVDASRVEARLAEIPGVREATVALLSGGDDPGALAAYVVVDGTAPPTMKEIRRAVAAVLPSHAVPARGYAVTALPLGAHGKLDRRALDPRLGPALPEGAGGAPPRDPLESELAAIWKDVLGLGDVGIHDRFVELGGDSLKAAALTLRIEERLTLVVSQSVLAEAPTIAEMAARLSLEAAAPATHSRVPLRVSGTRAPVFCVHDLESDAFLFSPLATRLGADQPVYGLRPPAGEPVGRLPRTLEALAARYVADLTAVAPHGPYALAGFCFGGTVALEMARLLAARGERVALLALLNVTAYDLLPLVSPRARAHFRRGWGARLRYLWRKPGALRWLGRRLLRAAGDLVGQVTLGPRLALLPGGAPASPALLRSVLREGFARHRPRPHSGSLVLFLAEETLPLYADDPREAWSGLASGRIEIHRLPHDGYAMLSEPDVSEVARVLGRHLEGLERVPGPETSPGTPSEPASLR
jgi:thioesterase domain-containing protein/acyl carrier protein